MTMSEVGEQLHAAREALKLTVQQIADVTKIRTDHIRALEEGHYEVFSAPVYIRGFVRIYAAQLKLNTSQIMSVLDAELKRSEKFKEPPPLMEESNTLLDHADVLAFQTELAGRSDCRRGVGFVAGRSVRRFGLAASCAHQSAGRHETGDVSIRQRRRDLAADQAHDAEGRMTN